MKANADFTPAMLRRIATEVYDGAVLAYQTHPTGESRSSLDAAADAYRLAHDLGRNRSSDHVGRQAVADAVNRAHEALNILLHRRSQL